MMMSKYFIVQRKRRSVDFCAHVIPPCGYADAMLSLHAHTILLYNPIDYPSILSRAVSCLMSALFTVGTEKTTSQLHLVMIHVGGDTDTL